jgi:hypothetical protein
MKKDEQFNLGKWQSKKCVNRPVLAHMWGKMEQAQWENGELLQLHIFHTKFTTIYD